MPTVLLVQPSSVIRANLRELLTSVGLTVLGVSNADEALSTWLAMHLDLILTSRLLDAGSELKMVRHIRHSGLEPVKFHVPIGLLSYESNPLGKEHFSFHVSVPVELHDARRILDLATEYSKGNKDGLSTQETDHTL